MHRPTNHTPMGSIGDLYFDVIMGENRSSGFPLIAFLSEMGYLSRYIRQVPIADMIRNHSFSKGCETVNYLH